MSRTFRALRVRNYRRYAAGQLVANTGVWMQRVAQDWLVLELTDGSAVVLGITVGLQFLPMLLLSLLGGTLADRFPRRPLLMVTAASMGLLAAVLGVVVLAGAATVPVVMVLAVLLGAVSAVDSPARQAFVSEMVDVEDLPNAVALGTASFNLGRVLGPSVAGLLIAAVGTGWVFLLNAAAFSAVLLALLGVRAAELREPVSPSRDNGGLREGLRYVRDRPELMTVLVVAFFVGTFGLNFNLYLATMTSEVFGGGAETFGVASTVLALGSLAGSLAAARRGVPRLRLVVLAAIGFGFASVTVALMPTYPAFLVALPLVGVSALTLINAMQSFLQINTAPEVRGRVLGIYMLVFLGGTPLGSPLVGWIADTLGPRWAIAIGGIVSALAAVVAGLLRLRGGGVQVRAHLTPRPHLHVGIPSDLTGVRPSQLALPVTRTRVVAAPLLVATVLLVGCWAAVPARAADDTFPAELLFTVKDERIVEASGMVAGRSLPGVTWIVNDGGSDPLVFGVDGSGRTVATVRLDGVDNRDWEALAAGTDPQLGPVLWVGDIGDNDRQHPSVLLYVIPEPDEPGDRSVQPVRYELTYPDGPHDAEALLVDPADGTVYIVTKAVLGGSVYRASDLVAGGRSELELVADAPSVVTDGTFAPRGGAVALRTYSSVFLLPSPTDEPAASSLLPPQPQGETLAWTVDGQSLLSGSESVLSQVYRVELPAAWAVTETSPASPPRAGGRSDEEDPSAALVAALVVGGVALGVGVAVGLSRAAARRSRSTR